MIYRKGRVEYEQKPPGTFLLAKIHGKLCFPHREVRQAIIGEWKHRTNADFYS